MNKILMTIMILGFSTGVFAREQTYGGDVTIHNKNCHALGKSWVKVNFWDSEAPQVWLDEDSNEEIPGCNLQTVKLEQDKSKHFDLVDHIRGLGYGTDGYEMSYDHHCKYKHEALGTVGGKRDVRGDRSSRVTCKKDWAGVCQCTKD